MKIDDIDQEILKPVNFSRAEQLDILLVLSWADKSGSNFASQRRDNLLTRAALRVFQLSRQSKAYEFLQAVEVLQAKPSAVYQEIRALILGGEE